jgi:hypothetical protein
VEHTAILEQIWGGQISVLDDKTYSPLAGLLKSLVDTPVIVLASSCSRYPVALSDSSELMPGVCLGDVLDEELGCYVPEGAVILVEPVEFTKKQDFSGRQLGEMLGNLLLGLLKKEALDPELAHFLYAQVDHSKAAMIVPSHMPRVASRLQ